MKTEIIKLDRLATRQRTLFGEFLVENRLLDRFQLFRVLQMQDRYPGIWLGRCAVSLGYVPYIEIEQLHDRYTQIARDAELEHMPTEAFHREIDLSY